MATSPHRHPEQVDVAEFEDSPPAENTAAGPFTDIIVNVPENITIRMVNAAALEDYELWFFISSLLATVVVGFVLAYLQAVDSNSQSRGVTGWTLVIFAILFLIALVVALSRRWSLRRRGRDIKLRMTAVSEKRD
jgi:H+/Cl- antiporter ClcA